MSGRVYVFVILVLPPFLRFVDFYLFCFLLRQCSSFNFLFYYFVLCLLSSVFIYIIDRILGVKVIVLASSAVDRGVRSPL